MRYFIFSLYGFLFVTSVHLELIFWMIFLNVLSIISTTELLLKKISMHHFFPVTLTSYCLFQMKRFNYSIHLPCGTEQNHSYLYIYIFFRWRNTGCYRMPPGRHQLALISLQKEEIWGLFQSTINLFPQVLSYKCNIKLNHLKLIFIHTYVC